MEAVIITHSINGTPIEDPRGVDQFEEELDRDYDKRIIASKYPLELTFKGGGYALLRDLYDEAICNNAEYMAIGTCGGIEDVVAKGKIILADIEWNLNRCEAKASLADDGVGARIINNIRAKVYPTAAKSKNGEDITPVAIRDVEFFDSTGVSVGTSQGFDWAECMEHLLAYITDDEVAFVSDWYTNLPASEKYCLLNGHELRTGNGTPTTPSPPSYSFEELWENAWKKHNLMAGVVFFAGQLTLRIETEDYWYGSVQVAAFDNQDELIESTDTKRIYASVVMGSEDYIKDEDGAYPYPFLILAGFTKEEFAISGQCNTDRRLELVSTFVIDTNVIYDVVENNVKTYDEKVFMVQYNSGTDKATIGQYLQPGTDPWLYNEQLLNSNVIARFNLPADASSNVIVQDADFQATNYAVQNVFTNSSPAFSTVYGSTPTQTQFSDDYDLGNFDTGNTWGNGTIQGNPVSQVNSRYRGPAQGYFQFEVLLNWSVYRKYTLATGTVDEEMTITSRMQRFDAGNVLLNQQDVSTTETFSANVGVNQTTFDFTQNFSSTHIHSSLLNASDYIIIEVFYTYHASASEPISYDEFEFKTTEGTRIKTVFISLGGGNIISDPDQYRSTLFSFTRFIPLGDWVSLRADPSKIVQIGPDTQLRAAHLFNAKRNVQTGETKWVLITNRASA